MLKGREQMCGNRRCYLCSSQISRPICGPTIANHRANQRTNERQLCAPACPLSKDTQVLNSPKPPPLNNLRNCNLSNPYIDRVCTESQRISVNANCIQIVKSCSSFFCLFLGCSIEH